MAFIGNISILSSIVLSIVVIFVAQLQQYRHILRLLFITQAICVLSAFLLLVYGFITSDFSVKNVFLNSSNILPLMYKVAGAWSSHEGSMLLWFTMLSTVVGFCINSIDEDLLSLGSLIVAPILCAFGGFIYLFANPFDQMGVRLGQGLGLNPILQDIGLMIHPPILYAGYVLYIGPFMYSCISLIAPDTSKRCYSAMLVYSRLGWLMLTIGVSLGSWWAYRELGWGGFWFFDPVENISLMPLLSAIAFHHSLIYSTAHGQLTRWTLFFGMSTFLLTILGTFFVRSGLLISVHAFANTTESAMMLASIVIVPLTFGIYLFCSRISIFGPEKYRVISKVYGVRLGNVIWIGCIIIMLFSLIYPLLLNLIGYTISVEPIFFQKTFLPIALPTALLAGSFAYFKTGDSILRYVIIAVIAVLITCGIYYFIPQCPLLAAFGILCSVYLLLATISKYVQKTNYFRYRISAKMTSMLISHFGYGLMILSISINSATQNEYDFIGQKGSSAVSDNYIIKLQNVVYDEQDNYYKQVAEFWITFDNTTIILKPENRLYKVEKALVPESAIYHSLAKDVYVVLTGIDKDVVHAKIYIRPCMSLLWISLIIMAGGIFISYIYSGTKKSPHIIKTP